jgi:predicted dehydrogenase
MKSKKNETRKVRYAVVGLGHIAQSAVLPAFQHAKKNSQLQAFVSGDPVKLKQLGKKYKVPNLYYYSQFEECLESGEIDAIYIATPNDQHQRYAEIAAEHGIHILCEKPLAVDESSCLSMLSAAKYNGVKLMTAYRLHFDPANLHAIEMAKSGKLGELKIFNSVFTMQVRDRNNIRLDASKGGGPLHDIGIYCINAARYLFRDEPVDVFAMGANSGQERFREVDEICTAILRFPRDRIASFTISFGAAESGSYDLVGTKARLRLENAYDYTEKMKFSFVKDGKTTVKEFPKHDQFAPELLYFSDCILNNKEPETSALEGLADLRVIDALFESRRIGSPVHISTVVRKGTHPSIRQAIMKPAIRAPKPVHATAPGGSN